MGLFGGPAVTAEAAPPDPRFNDPSPEGLFAGGKRLREFLEDMGLADVFVVRELVRSLDLGKLLAKYPGGGRPAYHPAAMLGLVLFGLMRGARSTRCLEKLARSDLQCWWLTGGLMPDHSVIARFINRHTEELSGPLFESLTRQVLERTGSDPTDLAGDGTVIQAVASRLDVIRQDVAAKEAKAARTRAEESPGVKSFQADAERAEKVAQIAAERAANRASKRGKGKGNTRINRHEPEAVNQKLKGGQLAPSYKPTVLANTDRIVVANQVHGSSEIAQVEPLLDQAQRVADKQPVKRVRFDAGFFAIALFTLGVARDLDLLVSEVRTASAKRPALVASAKLDKSKFKYDEASDTFTCPAGQRLVRKDRDRKRALARYGGAPCADCPQRSQCTQAKNGRTIKRYEGEELSEAMRVVMEHPLARAAYRQRAAMVEPVFADFHQRLNFKRLLRRGLRGAKLELSLTSMAHNLNRMLDLRRRGKVPDQAPPPSPLLCLDSWCRSPWPAMPWASRWAA